ncbi:hypothetical protein [Streptomyces sp. HNM0574]|uniref:hypothetical protein n=1 Tax=Streptomyces sp. HNM0574 TaxID=2714954 RepID=UPI00146EAE68|nr:hypothetical protein [Streptomyces sp. HNM0574]NLU66009.1 hypothetical protein [Streptomyces sp. HNM0574]
MRLEWARPGVLRATSRAHELAALVAAARLVAESPPPEISGAAREDLRRIIDDYDTQVRRLHGEVPPPEGESG